MTANELGWLNEGLDVVEYSLDEYSLAAGPVPCREALLGAAESLAASRRVAAHLDAPREFLERSFALEMRCRTLAQVDGQTVWTRKDASC